MISIQISQYCKTENKNYRRRRARCPPRRFVDAGDAPVANLGRRRHLQVARVQARRTRAPARPASPCFAAEIGRAHV